MLRAPVEVLSVERRLRVGRAARAADERQDELASADHADVAQPAAELLAVLKDVRRRGERTRLAGQVRPAAHQSRAVHVNQRVRDVEIFRDELTEERLVREAEPLMQIVDVTVARVPPPRRQIDQPLESDRHRLHAARRRRRPWPPSARTASRGSPRCVVRPAGTSTSASPSMWK